jgi:hypothetical protein
MMDSQDLTPNVGTPEENEVVDSSKVIEETPTVAEEQVEEPVAAEAVEEPAPEPTVEETQQKVEEPKVKEAEEKSAEEPKVYNTKEEVLQRVIELAHGEEIPTKRRWTT